MRFTRTGPQAWPRENHHAWNRYDVKTHEYYKKASLVVFSAFKIMCNRHAISCGAQLKQNLPINGYQRPVTEGTIYRYILKTKRTDNRRMDNHIPAGLLYAFSMVSCLNDQYLALNRDAPKCLAQSSISVRQRLSLPRSSRRRTVDSFAYSALF